MKPQTYIGLAVIAIILVLGAGIYMIREQHRDEVVQTPQEIPVPIDTTTERRMENGRIVAAMGEFARVAPELFEGNYVCKGGFINDEIKELKTLTETIVDNRLFDVERNQYAITQDEAGVSCIEQGDSWALFVPLNQGGAEVDADMHCVDSEGAAGAYGIDRDNAVCLVPQA